MDPELPRTVLPERDSQHQIKARPIRNEETTTCWTFETLCCLLRCGGRIHNAPLSEAGKFPYLLPQDNHLTLLIANHVHVSLSLMQVWDLP